MKNMVVSLFFQDKEIEKEIQNVLENKVLLTLFEESDNQSIDLYLTDSFDDLNEIRPCKLEPFHTNHFIPVIVFSKIKDHLAIKNTLSKKVLDYFSFPFNHLEVAAKIEYYLSEKKITNLPIDIDLILPIQIKQSLTLKELNILRLFLCKENGVLTRQEIADFVWGRLNVHPKCLDVHLYNLRKKLTPIDVKIVLIETGKWQIFIN